MTDDNKHKVRMLCHFCGSEHVLLEAWAQWNVERQEWELADTLQLEHCADCDGETEIEEVPVGEEYTPPDSCDDDSEEGC